MQKIKLTVFFDGLFWVGILERIRDGRLEACKITFGSEPKDYEIYGFLSQNWNQLKFSPPVDAGGKKETRVNPKRRQREVKKQLEMQGTGTKAQQALQLMREQGKLEHKAVSRREREAEKERKFELQQEKRKKKHRGH